MQALDKIDLKILQSLQENGRLTNVELSERVNLSPPPCLRRLKLLEDTGVISRYVALLNPENLGLGLQAYISVTMEKPSNIRQSFEVKLQEWPEILSCTALTGHTDYLLHAYFVDMKDFSHFILDTLLSQPGVIDAKSSFVLQEVKNDTKLPLKHLIK